MADLLPEKWMKGVAITTTCLAVLTSIASSRAGFCVAQAQLKTALEGSQWSYYQAKSIKQNLAQMQKESFEASVLGAANVEQKAHLDAKISAVTPEIARYEKEKSEIKALAEKTGEENSRVNRQGGNFSMAVVFFQIAIMLSSVSALLKRKEMWVFGLVFGVIAIVYLANGLFLFF